MTTLLIRLAGPLQSWGVRSKFNDRSTGLEPSKSGVIGMIASALGRTREDSIDDLNRMRFGVRIDQVGTTVRDYQTVTHPHDIKRSYVTRRFYLEDYVFLAGLEGDPDLLKEADEALVRPAHPLFLGRRSCPVDGKVSMGVFECNLDTALYEAEWQASDWYRHRCPRLVFLEAVLDSDVGYTGSMQPDIPCSFSQLKRCYQNRDVVHRPLFKKIINEEVGFCRENSTEHDAFAFMRGY